MPHLIVEHSGGAGARVDWKNLLGELHRVTAATIGSDIRNCKSRVMRRDLFRVGDDDCTDGFLHVDVQVLEGRSTNTRRELADKLLATLRHALAGEADSVQITVYVHDIERAVYAKHPQGSLTPPERMR